MPDDRRPCGAEAFADDAGTKYRWVCGRSQHGDDSDHVARATHWKADARVWEYRWRGPYLAKHQPAPAPGGESGP